VKQRLTKEIIAMRVGRELFDGAVVNLGFGMPSLASSYVPEGIRVIFHSENGVLGYGSMLTEEQQNQWDYDLINASAQFVRPAPGMSLFDIATSFGMIRGGHIDITVLGALQVSERGDLANWRAPGKTGGMGGAMDLAVSCKKVIVAMEHTTKDGQAKVVNECTYPLTAKRCVNLILTDLAVMEVREEGLVLKEIAPGWTVDEVQCLTEPTLHIAPDLKEIEL
jgi:3-oxoacid CoA-transferase B subunit